MHPLRRLQSISIRTAALVAFGLFAVYSGLLAVLREDPSARAIFVQPWLLAAGVLTSVLLYRAARVDSARREYLGVAWSVLAISQCISVVGELASWWSGLQAIPRAVDWQLDLVFLIADGLFVYAILLTRRPSSIPGEGLRTLLDLAISGLGAVLVSWYFFVVPMVSANAATTWSVVIVVSYGALYGIMVFASLDLVFVRRTSVESGAVLLLAGGALARMLSGVVAVPTCPPIGSCQAGDWDSSLILLSYALVGLAALRHVRAGSPEEAGRSDPAGPPGSRSIWTLYFPYVGFVIAYLLLIRDRTTIGPATSIILISAAGVISVVVIIRQVLMVNENVRLYRTLQRENAERKNVEEALQQAHGQLEQRVADRTAELARERNLLRTLIDHLPDAIYAKDLHNRFLVSNSAHAARYGRTPAQVIGKTAVEIAAPGAEDRSEEDDRRVLRAGDGFIDVEEPGPSRTDGRAAWSLTTKVPLLDGRGNVSGLVAVARDITERRQAEETLRASEARLRALVGSIDEIVFELDEQGTYLNVWTGNASLLARPAHELLGRRVGEILDPQAARPIDEACQRVLRTGRPETIEYPLEVQTGRRWFSAHISPIPVSGGGRKTVSLLSRDITASKQAEEALVGRTRIMETLYETSLEINSHHDIPSLLGAMVQRAASLLGVGMGAFYLMRPDGESIELIVQRNIPERYNRTVLRLGEGLSGRIAATGEAMMVGDYRQWEGQAQVYEEAPFRRTLGVPLKWRDKIVGVLTLTDGVKTGEFTDDEMRLARLFADQAALAVENTRLFEETKRRADQFGALYETAHDLSTFQDPSNLLPTIVERAVRLLGATGGGMYVYDAATAELQVEVSTHPTTPVGTRLRLGEGMAGRVAQTRQPLTVDDYRTWPERSPKYAGAPLTAVLEVPMLHGGELIGVLVVEEVGETQHRFNDEDARLLSLFAGQAASAIYNAHLIAETRHRAERLALLNRIGRAVSGTLKLDDLLEIVYQELAMVTNADAFFVALYEQATGELDYRIRVDGGIREPAQQRMLRPGLTYSIVETRKPLLIRDYENEKEHWPIGHLWGTMRQPLSWLGVPMLLGDKLLGVISVQAYRRGAFSEADQELLSTVADRVALAVENARLFEETNRRADQLATLREIDRTLSSILDLEPMLDTMLSRLEQIVPYESGVVLLLDGSTLGAVAARGRVAPDWKGFFLDVSQNAIFKQMAEAAAPVLIEDLSGRADWVFVPGIQGARAWLGVPLIARGQVIGQIGLFASVPGRITREHCDLVMAFANHAAIAIANARLHAELQDQARRDSLTQVLNHGAFISELRAAHANAESMALIMLDLDDFKSYNDSHGHVAGDAALTAVVRSIQAHVKKGDLVGRWGGDEFGVALREAKAAEAVRVAERIRVTLAGMQILDRQDRPIPPLTVSQGIAALPENAPDVDGLIERADAALYRAKERGRDQVARAD